MKRRLLLLSVAAMLLVPPVVDAGAPPVGTTSVFARVPDPGMPEGLIVREGVVYVSTHVSVRGNGGQGPSRIFRYALADGSLLGSFAIQGQDLDGTHGVLAMAFDASGRLYVVDRNPGRVLRFDLATDPPTQQTYATVPDLPRCGPTVGEPCSPTTLDQATFADYIAFLPDGSMVVTDLEAATIFRVPAGGGQAEVWFQDQAFDGVFGLNGIVVDPTGTKVYFAMTGSQAPTSPLMGVIYTLPIVDQPTADDLAVFHTFVEPASGPDGIAFGASGRLYVALAGHNQVAILAPDGTQLHRFPDAASNQQQEVPYDLPASVAFDGQGNLLITNQSFFTANPDNWAVLRAFVDDTAAPLIEPVVP